MTAEPERSEPFRSQTKIRNPETVKDLLRPIRSHSLSKAKLRHPAKKSVILSLSKDQPPEKLRISLESKHLKKSVSS
jgi:hypothetical protein